MRRSFYPGFVPAIFLIAMMSFAAAKAAAQRPSLELLDMKASASQSDISLVGQVKNISPTDVSGVTVYCDFINGNRKVVRTEEGTLEPDPLSPNKTAQFKCNTKTSPEIKGFNIPRFERLFGGPLVVKDSRKSK